MQSIMKMGKFRGILECREPCMIRCRGSVPQADAQVSEGRLGRTAARAISLCWCGARSERDEIHHCSGRHLAENVTRLAACKHCMASWTAAECQRTIKVHATTKDLPLAHILTCWQA